jgi:hypothetical protein
MPRRGLVPWPLACLIGLLLPSSRHSYQDYLSIIEGQRVALARHMAWLRRSLNCCDTKWRVTPSQDPVSGRAIGYPPAPTHLQRVGALACRRGHGRGLDDLDAGEADPVAGAHLLVQLLHGAVEGGVAVLLVHVVVPSPALVADPDAKVLDGRGPLLEDLRGGGMHAASATASTTMQQ